MKPLLFATLMLPFWGTALGACAVLFVRHRAHPVGVQRMSGLAAGVMTAACVWSLLIPAMEYSAKLGRLCFLPAAVGLWAGFLFLQFCDRLLPPLPEECTMTVFAVILHNIPEGMAVGAIAAGFLTEGSGISFADVFALTLGITLQNIPEGSIISLPLKAQGTTTPKAFLWGVFSGAVEPVAAVLTLLLARLLVPILPVMLGFAAGAMLSVVVEELVPQFSGQEKSTSGILFFALGFSIMMTMDVALG